MYFWIFPVDVFGSSFTKSIRLGHLNPARRSRQYACKVSVLNAASGFRTTKAFGTSPKRWCGLGHNSNFQHRGVRVDDALDLESGNIFSARYDDVLGAILDFHITVGMEHGQIARVEPSSAECVLSGLGIPVVTFHERVSADDDFADLLAVRFD